MRVAIVAAIAENGVIGDAGGMPWHYPADLARFKELTIGHPVILGRRTFESIVDRLGEPLPERLNVVLSTRDLDLPTGAVRAASIDEALEIAAATGSKTVFVVGGASVYEQFLPEADRLHLTEIPEAPDGGTTFPDWDRSNWDLVDSEERGEVTFRTYDRAEA
ncbi:MAG: dihydrofolate reductase [Halodesulfurarchaeum sp.]